MNITSNRGILWALGTALVSGFSIYVNKFGVAQVQNAFVYTTLKNSLVVIAFVAAVGIVKGWQEIRSFSTRQWVGWLGLGIIGGGVPFLLFFQGLSMASAPSAALIHKTLFLWVALLAVPLLGERLGWWQVVALGVLAAGQFLLQPPASWGWGSGETMMLIATLLWASETILAKKLLAGMSAPTAALGRMGVGVVVMWVFLTVNGQAGAALSITSPQWLWVALTAAFLAAYVWTWYSALKSAPATLVSSVLTLGAVFTILLNTLLEGNAITSPQVVAITLLVIGALVFSWGRPRQLVPEMEA